MTGLAIDEYHTDTWCEVFLRQRSELEVQDLSATDHRPSKQSRLTESERDIDQRLVDSILRHCFEWSKRHPMLLGSGIAPHQHFRTVVAIPAVASSFHYFGELPNTSHNVRYCARANDSSANTQIKGQKGCLWEFTMRVTVKMLACSPAAFVEDFQSSKWDFSRPESKTTVAVY